MTTAYKVEEHERSHYIMGLEFYQYPDTMLIYHYEGGDIDTRMRNMEMMHAALYDLVQVNNKIKDGDRFETEFGAFEVRGFDVVRALANNPTVFSPRL